jgi:hypothetical protein
MPSIITAGNATNGLAMSSDGTGTLNIRTGSGTGTTAIAVDASQNVGVGTSTPLSKLDVVGPASVTSFTGTTKLGLSVRGSTSTNDYSGIDLYGANTATPTARIAVISTGGGSSLQFGTSNSYVSGITNTGMSIDQTGVFAFNSGYGSAAVAYGCRAWVNFNGTGTPAIRASGNVTSITDNGTGDYTVNFTTAMPDVNYATNITVDTAAANNSPCYSNTFFNQASASAIRMIITNNGTSYIDLPRISVSVFR